MNKKFGLTDTEYEIMLIFWERKGALTFREIQQICSTELKKDWKKQTLNTYLSKLVSLGLLVVKKEGTKNKYHAVVKKKDFMNHWLNALCDSVFQGSIYDLVLTYAGTKPINKKEVEKLKKLIDDWEE